MATLADETAVAHSSRTHFTLIAAGMPWADQVDELLDELASEQLPDALVKDRLTARLTRRQQALEQQQARDAARERVTAAQERLGELTDEELTAFEADLETAYGSYGAWQLQGEVRREKQRRAQPTGEQAAA